MEYKIMTELRPSIPITSKNGLTFTHENKKIPDWLTKLTEAKWNAMLYRYCGGVRQASGHL